eukprot:6072020-Prymnesium_polylepis.1
MVYRLKPPWGRRELEQKGGASQAYAQVERASSKQRARTQAVHSCWALTCTPPWKGPRLSESCSIRFDLLGLLPVAHVRSPGGSLSEPSLREWNLDCLRAASSLAVQYYIHQLKSLHSMSHYEWPEAPLRDIVSSHVFERSTPSEQVGEALKSCYLGNKLLLPCMYRGEPHLKQLKDVIFMTSGLVAKVFQQQCSWICHVS